MKHATRGSLPGPFVKLSPALRRLALDLALTLLSLTVKTNTEAVEFATAVTTAVNGLDEGMYWSSLTT
jgi:hypothetical protein